MSVCGLLGANLKYNHELFIFKSLKFKVGYRLQSVTHAARCAAGFTVVGSL